MNKPIAIIGIGCLFPDAKNPAEFWNNIISKKDSIRDVPEKDNLWLKEDFYSDNPNDDDKTYGLKASYLPEINFDPIEYGIPPIVADDTDVKQLLALVVAKQALGDAMLLKDNTSEEERKRIGVIIGDSGMLKRAAKMEERLECPNYEKILKQCGLPDDMRKSIVEKIKSLYPEIKESSLPGSLNNVIAGRISNRFDLMGLNHTVDAACASSLAAIKSAVMELRAKTCDAILTGGVGNDNSISQFVSFCKTPVMSPKGSSRPFDDKADGLILGEGIGMVVLKRLEDAQKAGDHVYAVIRGIGASSDGRALSIYAPNFKGQMLALERAIEDAGTESSDIELVEAHGTAAFIGDLTEFKSLSAVLNKYGLPVNSVAIGSIKSQIGHLRSGAGIASVIKTALGLRHRILPPTINVDKPNSYLNFKKSPFYLNTETRPWISTKKRRKAFVNAFGFGGTNYCVLMEEYLSENKKKLTKIPFAVIIDAPSIEKLIDKCGKLTKEWTENNAASMFMKFLLERDKKSVPDENPRIGFAAYSHEGAMESIEKWLAEFEKKQESSGIHFRASSYDCKKGVVALFPGQESQYPDMCASLAGNYEEIGSAFELFDKARKRRQLSPISSIVYPVPVFEEKKKIKQREELANPINAQPAVSALSIGIYNILHELGFKPDFFAGSGSGELTALFASGILDEKDFTNLVVGEGKTETNEASIESVYEKGPLFVEIGPKNILSDQVRRTMGDREHICVSVNPLPTEDDTLQFIDSIVQLKVLGLPLEYSNNFPAKKWEEITPMLETKTSIKIDGNMYYSRKVKQQRKEAFSKPEHSFRESFEKQEDKSDMNEKKAEKQTLTPMERYHGNQEKYLNLLSGIFDKYDNLIQKSDKDALSASLIESMNKNIEIISANQKHYHNNFGESDDSREEIVPLKKESKPIDIIGQFDFSVPADFSIPETESTQAHPETQEDESTENHTDSMMNLLLNIISEKTGYPVDTMTPKMELEADMGIDSIKRIEIFSALGEVFPDSDIEPESLYDLKTITDIADFLEKHKEEFKIEKEKEVKKESNAETTHEFKRFAVVQSPLSLPDQKDIKLPEKFIWLITDDGKGVAMELAKSFVKKGEQVVLLALSEEFASKKASAKSVKHIVLKEMTEKCLNETRGMIEKKFGKVGGFIHIHPKQKKIKKIDEFFNNKTKHLVKTIFFMAKVFSASLKEAGMEGNAYFYIMPGLKGEFGISPLSPESCLVSGLSGLVKSLAAEWINVQCRYIDIFSGFDKKESISFITRELKDPDRSAGEIAVNKERKRFTITKKNADITETEGDISEYDNDVFAVTGGGRGITAACIKKFSETANCKFAIIGRTDADAKEPEWAINCDSERELRDRLIKEAKKKNKRMIPAKIGEKAEKILAARQIKNTIDIVRNNGCETIYIQADVTDAASLEKALANVEKKIGKITGIIHGAGNIADKKIEAKTEDDFRLVFDTKIAGLENLINIIKPEKIRHLVFFSSIAAFSGNEGQTDYGFANEVLNKFAYSFKHLCPQTNVTSINWGAWDGGMVKSSISEMFSEHGIPLLPENEGADFFTKEMTNYPKNIQILIAPYRNIPLQKQEKLFLPDKMKIERSIKPDDNPFLEHHVIEGASVLPASCAMNWLIGTGMGLRPFLKFGSLKNFNVLKGIVFDKNVASEYETEIIVKRNEEKEAMLELKISSNPEKKKFYHYQGELKLSNDKGDLPNYTSFDLDEDNKCSIKGFGFYDEAGPLFHGKTFHGVESVANIGDEHITVKGRLMQPPIAVQGQFRTLFFNPYSVDVGLQAVGIWLFFQKRFGLPLGCDKAEWFGDAGESVFYISAKIVSDRKNILIADIYAHDDKGSLYYRISGAKFTTKRIKK